jgi:hypothetical protein
MIDEHDSTQLKHALGLHFTLHRVRGTSAETASSDRVKRTLAYRINIDVKLARLWESANRIVPEDFRVFPGGGSSDLRAWRAT